MIIRKQHLICRSHDHEKTRKKNNHNPMPLRTSVTNTDTINKNFQFYKQIMRKIISIINLIQAKKNKNQNYCCFAFLVWFLDKSNIGSESLSFIKCANNMSITSNTQFKSMYTSTVYTLALNHKEASSISINKTELWTWVVAMDTAHRRLQRVCAWIKGVLLLWRPHVVKSGHAASDNL